MECKLSNLGVSLVFLACHNTVKAGFDHHAAKTEAQLSCKFLYCLVES